MLSCWFDPIRTMSWVGVCIGRFEKTGMCACLFEKRCIQEAGSRQIGEVDGAKRVSRPEVVRKSVS